MFEAIAVVAVMLSYYAGYRKGKRVGPLSGTMRWRKKDPREFTMIFDKTDPDNPGFHVYTRGTIKPGPNQEAVDVREIWH